jgi:hypothetical protein
MNSERIIVETDDLGNIKNLPFLKPNHRFEVVIRDMNSVNTMSGRRIDPAIAGRLEIIGDVIDSTPAADWNLPR